jgi:hypothetical protein
MDSLMSILCALKRDNLYPVRDMSPMTGIQKAKPLECAFAVIVHIPPSLLTYKPLPMSPNLEIIDPKQYLIPSEILDEIQRIPQKHDGIVFCEDVCRQHFSPETRRHQALLAIQNGVIAGALFGMIEEDSFHVCLLGVHSLWRSSKGAPSREKVGTKLLLVAMQKTMDVFKRFKLTLDYNPGTNETGVAKSNCERRNVVYPGLAKKLRMPYDRELEEIIEDDLWDKTIHMTYYLWTQTYKFNFEQAMAFAGS